jgi:hypothetical protein
MELNIDIGGRPLIAKIHPVDLQFDDQLLTHKVCRPQPRYSGRSVPVQNLLNVRAVKLENNTISQSMQMVDSAANICWGRGTQCPF